MQEVQRYIACSREAANAGLNVNLFCELFRDARLLHRSPADLKMGRLLALESINQFSDLVDLRTALIMFKFCFQKVSRSCLKSELVSAILEGFACFIKKRLG